MIDTPAVKLKDAQAKIKRIELPDQQLDSMKMHLTNSIYEVSLRIQEQENWLKAYFRRGKSSRKLMFYEKKHF